jgi:hypothetical protein
MTDGRRPAAPAESEPGELRAILVRHGPVACVFTRVDPIENWSGLWKLMQAIPLDDP